MTSSKESLRSRVIKSSIWVISGNGVSQVLRLANNLILARLLMPEVFGIMAIVSSIQMGLAFLSDVGLSLYIIQSKRGDDPELLDAIWSISIVRGLLLWIVALLLCFGLFLAGQFDLLVEDTAYATPILPWVLAVASFDAVIAGFESTKLVTARRHLVQKQLVLIELSTQAIGIAIMIALALIYKSVWALVVGGLIGALLKTILSHTILPGVSNRWEWSWPIFWSVLNFGQWIFLSSTAYFLFICGDRLLLGGLISASALGIYTIAFMMVSTLKGTFMTVNSDVAFPAISESFRRESDRLKESYYQFRFRLDSAIIAIAALLMVFGEIIIDVLFDDRYSDAGPMLRLLSLLMISQIYELAGQCFLALGKPKLLSMLNAIQAAALLTFLPVGFWLYGLDGAIWGIVLSYFSAVPASMIIKARYGILDLKYELTVLAVWISVVVVIRWFAG